jgi:carboxyl-terminal processing protease
MVAGALQDGQRATILGTLTVGRGAASEFRELSDGSALYIPVARWYTPSGRLIQGVGISPDIEVPLSDQDRLFGVDSQLAEAYQLLDDQLPDFR